MTATLISAAFLALPAGVTCEVTECGCDDAACFFCGAREDALIEAYAEAEMAEWREKNFCLECDTPWREAYATGHCRECGTCPGHPLGHVAWCTEA